VPSYKQRNRFLRRGLSALGPVAAVAFIGASMPGRETVPGLSFRISSSTRISVGENASGQDDQIMRGRGIAARNHARIELLAMTPLPDGVTLNDFILALDSGVVYVLHTNSRNYTLGSDMFGGPGIVALARSGGGGRGAGRAGVDSTAGGGGGRAARGGRGGASGGGGGGAGFPGRGGRGRGRGGISRGFLDQTQLRDVKFEIEKLGAGDTIDGRPTQHYRINADYRIVWGGQVVDAHAVTELWSAALPTMIPNPFEPLSAVETAPDGPLLEYILKLTRIRNQVEGVPIKVTTTTTLSGLDNVVGLPGLSTDDPARSTMRITQTTAITSIKETDVDEKQLVIPEGFSSPGGE